MDNILQAACVSCMKVEDLFNIYESHVYAGVGEVEPFSLMLRDTFCIEIDPRSNLKSVCCSCVLQMKKASNFKRQILKSIEEIKQLASLELDSLEDDELVKVIHQESSVKKSINVNNLVKNKSILTSNERSKCNYGDTKNDDKRINKNKKATKVIKQVVNKTNISKITSTENNNKVTISNKPSEDESRNALKHVIIGKKAAEITVVCNKNDKTENRKAAPKIQVLEQERIVPIVYKNGNIVIDASVNDSHDNKDDRKIKKQLSSNELEIAGETEDLDSFENLVVDANLFENFVRRLEVKQLGLEDQNDIIDSDCKFQNKHEYVSKNTNQFVLDDSNVTVTVQQQKSQKLENVKSMSSNRVRFGNLYTITEVREPSGSDNDEKINKTKTVRFASTIKILEDIQTSSNKCVKENVLHSHKEISPKVNQFSNVESQLSCFIWNEDEHFKRKNYSNKEITKQNYFISKKLEKKTSQDRSPSVPDQINSNNDVIGDFNYKVRSYKEMSKQSESISKKLAKILFQDQISSVSHQRNGNEEGSGDTKLENYSHEDIPEENNAIFEESVSKLASKDQITSNTNEIDIIVDSCEKHSDNIQLGSDKTTRESGLLPVVIKTKIHSEEVPKTILATRERKKLTDGKAVSFAKQKSVRFLEDYKIEAPKTYLPMHKVFNLDPDQTQCSICTTSFATRKKLYEHMHEHYPQFECEVCCKKFVHQSNLKRHMETHLEGPFVCVYCDKLFTKLHSRNSHVWRKHQSAAPYKCSKCDERFPTFNQRLNHMKQHHGLSEPKYSCTQCERMYFESGALWKHMRATHQSDRNFTCTKCPMKFDQVNALLNHLATKHGIGEKNFSCSHCGKKFFNGHTLKRHQKLHCEGVSKKDKLFQCNICGTTFSYLAVLKCHLKGHEFLGRPQEQRGCDTINYSDECLVESHVPKYITIVDD